jgi:hypothetical protein
MNKHNFHTSVAPDTTAQSASGVTTPDILAEKKEQQQDYQGIEDDGKSAQAEDSNDVKEEYPSGLMLVPILIAILCAVFLTALDMTIIGTAIPKITDEFEGLNMVSWVSQTLSH